MRQIAVKLEAEIVNAVSLIVAASRAAALEAVEEAFGFPQEKRRQSAVAAPRQHARRRAEPSPRRSSAQIQALEEKFLAAVWQTPGESMSALAPLVGVTAVRLQVPVARLKAAGIIKTVGERQFTRYFPVERGQEGSAVGGGLAPNDAAR